MLTFGLGERRTTDVDVSVLGRQSESRQDTEFLVCLLQSFNCFDMKANQIQTNK